MSIAELIRAMGAAGANAEAIAIAVEAVEAAGAVDAERREKARLKKRAQRAGTRDTGGTVPGLSRDNAGTVHTKTPAPAPALPPDPQPTPTHTPVGFTPAHQGLPAGLATMVAIAALDAIVAAARRRRWKDMPPPVGVSDEQWAGFLDHRKRGRCALTPRAYVLLVGKLAGFAEAGWPPGELIDTAVERNWRSVFIPKDEPPPNAPASRHHPGQHEHRNPMVRALAGREARRADRSGDAVRP